MTQQFLCDAGPFKGQWIEIKGESTIEVLCGFRHGRGHYRAVVDPKGNRAEWTGVTPKCFLGKLSQDVRHA